MQNWQKNTQKKSKVKQGSPSLEWTHGLGYRLDLVSKYINFDDKKVLDVGCGIGMFLSQFEKLGADVYGIDVDKDKVKLAKEKFVNVKLGYAENIPFSKDTFDIVWLHEVIEHVDDDEKTIRECFRVLKPTGKLVIFCPNRAWPFESHGMYLGKKYIFGNIPFITWLPGKIYKKLTPHVRNYTKKDLFEIMKGASFKIIVHKKVYPGFDRLGSKVPIIGPLVKKLFRLLEKVPILNRFGISHMLVVEKLS